MPNIGSYEGAWGVYPLLPSGNVIVSDMQEGLFIIRPDLVTDVHTEGKPSALSFPNPAAIGGTLTLNGLGDEEVCITDLAGRQLATATSDANGRLTVPETLEAGWYLFCAESTDSSLTYRVLCQP
jgi:hypothetical protein